MAANIYSSAVGVGINEIDKSLSIQNNSKSSAFFAGYFKRGDCNSLVTVNSLQEFYDTFGERDKTNHNDWMQAYNYLQYAGNLIISRSVGSNSRNSVAEFPLNKNVPSYIIYNHNDFENKKDSIKLVLGNQLKFMARNPGIWGNDIKVMMITHNDFINNTLPVFSIYKPQSIFRDIPTGESGLIVFYKDVPVEIYNVSFNETSTNFIEKINYSSNYIFLNYVSTTGTIDGFYRYFDGIEIITDEDGYIDITVNFEEDTAFTLDQIDTTSGIFSDLYQISNSEYTLRFKPSIKYIIDLYIEFEQSLPPALLTSNVYYDGNKDLRDHPSYSDLTKDIEFSFYGDNALSLSGGLLYEPSISDLEMSYNVAADKEVEIDYIIANEQVPLYVKNIANSRKDIIAFIGTPKFEGSLEEIKSQIIDFRLNTLGDSDYCFLVCNYKKIFNNTSKKYEYCNLAGDITGLRVKTDTEYNRWTSSAGESRGNLIGGELVFYPNREFIDDLYLKGINNFAKNSTNGIKLYGNRIMTLKASSLDRLTTRILTNYIIRELEKSSRYAIFELIDDFLKNDINNKLRRFLQYVKNDRGITDFIVNVSDDAANNKLIINVIFAPNYVADFIEINFINTGTSAFVTTS